MVSPARGTKTPPRLDVGGGDHRRVCTLNGRGYLSAPERECAAAKGRQPASEAPVQVRRCKTAITFFPPSAVAAQTPRGHGASLHQFTPHGKRTAVPWSLGARATLLVQRHKAPRLRSGRRKRPSFRASARNLVQLHKAPRRRLGARQVPPWATIKPWVRAKMASRSQSTSMLCPDLWRMTSSLSVDPRPPSIRRGEAGSRVVSWVE